MKNSKEAGRSGGRPIGGRTIPAGRTPLFLGGLKSYIPEDLSWSLFTHSTVGHIPGLAKNFFNDIRWREA